MLFVYLKYIRLGTNYFKLQFRSSREVCLKHVRLSLIIQAKKLKNKIILVQRSPENEGFFRNELKKTNYPRNPVIINQLSLDLDLDFDYC